MFKICATRALTFLFMLLSFSMFAYSKDLSDKISAGIVGMVGLSTFNETTTLTFGGPQVALKMGDITVATSFYPSLVRSDLFDYETRPALGFGGEVQYKQLVIFVPTYYLGNKYRTTLGIGYRF